MLKEEKRDGWIWNGLWWDLDDPDPCAGGISNLCNCEKSEEITSN